MGAAPGSPAGPGAATEDPNGGYGYEDGNPYRFDSGPYLFTDWRYVVPGTIVYRSSTGEELALKGSGSIEGITTSPVQVPSGVHLEAQRAEKIGPLILNDKPWEHQIAHSSLHYLDGKYRLWYWAKPLKDEDTTTGLLCYAESPDALHWTKPNLGLIPFKGSKETNIVFQGTGCTVFVDPAAPPQERIKAIYISKERSPGNVARLKQRSPASVTPRGEALKLELCMAVSGDGLHWQALPEPVMSHMSDTQNTVYYDAILKKYVGYFRMLYYDRRAIGRAETTDYRRWPAPDLMLWPTPQDDASDDYYTNGKALYPGTKSAHLLFPTIYQRRLDSTAIRIASSPDGKIWTWANGAVLEPGPEGSWDGGCVFAAFGLTEIPGDRIAIPYTGYRYPHKFPRMVRVGEIGLAAWKKERLVALAAPLEGEIHTRTMKLTGNTLHLNFETRRTGGIQVEVLSRGKPVQGRRLEDCDLVWGDSLKARVSWKGHSDLGVAPGEPVQFRIRLRAAKLFSFEIRSA